MDLKIPITENINDCKAGEWVELSGSLVVMRDAAHKRLLEANNPAAELSLDMAGQVIFYAGPTNSIVEGQGQGVIGPTTSARMDRYVEAMLKLGVKGFLGKGPRGDEVAGLMKEYGAIYLATVGGAAALLSKFVKQATIIAYRDLGPEAIYHLEVAKFPAIIAIDARGKSIF